MIKKRKPKNPMKANLQTLEDLANAGVIVFGESLPGAKALLKPLRKMARATGMRKLIEG